MADQSMVKKFNENGRVFKSTIDRIIEKYSKLQYEDGGIEVDLEEITPQAVKRYMSQSELKLTELESKGLSDLRDESIRAEDVSADTQFDSTGPDDGAAEGSVFSHFSGPDSEENMMLDNDDAEAPWSLSDESWRNISKTDVQPEDEDEELENTLRSRNNSLVELYPSAIGRIGQACYRHDVLNAADSVLRRYHRLRLNRTMDCTFDVPTEGNSKPKRIRSKAVSGKTSDALKRKKPQVFCTSAKAAFRPLLSRAIHMRALQRLKSPDRDVSQIRAQSSPVQVMNLCLDPMSSSEQRRAEAEQNESFPLSEVCPPSTSSQLREQQPSFTVSPARPCYPTAKAPMDPLLRSHRLSQSPHRVQKAAFPLCAPETSAVPERPNTHRSPHSLQKTRLGVREAHGGSPQPGSVGSGSKRSRFMSRSGSSPRQSPARPPRRLFPRDPCHAFQSELQSSQSPHRVQKAVYHLYGPETSTVLEGPYVHHSPTRQSLLKTRLPVKEAHVGSPHARSPKPESGGSGSKRSRFMSGSGSSPRQSPALPPRRLFPQDPCHSFQSQWPQSASALFYHRPERRHSIDSSALSRSSSFSPKQLNDEFTKAYHTFVCQSRSSPSTGRPCSMCAAGAQASRGHSSSGLAALALSPHTVLRKRRRDLDWSGIPEAKRQREKYGGYSPGSQRHGKLVPRLCPSELKYHLTQQSSVSPRKVQSRFDLPWKRPDHDIIAPLASSGHGGSPGHRGHCV
ncbi:uncharacterized protein LOC143002935 [Genypterus blacodes]|uniref:uncharacterized protein LOC143002935 n=1 Tax=Genypterus blacodes TaxID=154954 RepID=UPI003F767440